MAMDNKQFPMTLGGYSRAFAGRSLRWAQPGASAAEKGRGIEIMVALHTRSAIIRRRRDICDI
jgi:hypothetical protein